MHTHTPPTTPSRPDKHPADAVAAADAFLAHLARSAEFQSMLRTQNVQIALRCWDNTLAAPLSEAQHAAIVADPNVGHVFHHMKVRARLRRKNVGLDDAAKVR